MKNYFFILISMILFALTSCQKDELLMVIEDNTSPLKSSEVDPGIFEGEYLGSKWRISLPNSWNDQETQYMVFYAHDMIDPDEQTCEIPGYEFPNDILAGKPVEQLVNEMNMGYAITCNRENGLIIFEHVEYIRLLVDVMNEVFNEHDNYERPDYLFLVGSSEGGLATVLAIEKYPDLFDGALSICGPIGDYYRQLQYNGDFHVLFNYFFEDILRDRPWHKYVGNPVSGVGESTMIDWKMGDLQEVIKFVMDANPSKVEQLLKCAKVKVNMEDPVAMEAAIFENLHFNIMFTNDITTRLQGVPFNNIDKWYQGSDDDEMLNLEVQRVLTPDYYTAANNVRKYETKGIIETPLVTIHTKGDPIIPFWHYSDYRSKIIANGNKMLYSGIKVDNYEHCSIEKQHIIKSFNILKKQLPKKHGHK